MLRIAAALSLLGAACTGTSDSVLEPMDEPQPLLATAISAKDYHSCALEPDGHITCWGKASQIAVPAGTFVAVSTGREHTCAIRSDSTVACAGTYFDGSDRPVLAPTGAFMEIASGADFTCGLRRDRTVECWGRETTTPTGTFLMISAGWSRACGIRDGGTVECWGYGAALLPGSFATIASGGYFDCALDAGGAIACTYLDQYPLDTNPPPADRFTAIGVGESRACGIRTDGTIACWGSSTEWLEAQSDWRPGPPALSFASISLGDGHACAIDTAGRVMCWGRDYFGQATPPTR